MPVDEIQDMSFRYISMKQKNLLPSVEQLRLVLEEQGLLQRLISQ